MPITTPQPQRMLQWAASLQPGSYGFSSSKQTTATRGNGDLTVSPVYFHRSVTIDRIGCEVTSAGEAGSLLRIGVYADNGDFLPGELVLDAGTVAGDSTGIKEVTVSKVIPQGIVWVGLAFQNAATTRPTVRAISGSPPYASGDNNTANARVGAGIFTGVTGALPTTWTTNAVSGTCARIFWRIAS